MPFTRQPIQSHANGVSQQPAAIRHPSQCESQVNMWPDLALGNERRPALEFAGRPTVASSADVDASRIIFPLSNGEVWTAGVDISLTKGIQLIKYPDQTEATVNVSLHTIDVINWQSDNRLSSLDDVGNHPVKFASTDESLTVNLFNTNSLGNQYTGTIIVEEADTINGTWSTTDSRAILSDANAKQSYVVSMTGKNGKWIRCRLTGVGGGAQDFNVQFEFYDISPFFPAVFNSGQNSTEYLKMVAIQDTVFVINTEMLPRLANAMEQGLKTSDVSSFSALPGVSSGTAVSGQYYKVVGDDTTAFDEYWVLCTTAGAAPAGVYEEVAEVRDQPYFRLYHNIDPHSMPFILTPDATVADNFTFSPAPWQPRNAGGEENNPVPSFVGTAGSQPSADDLNAPANIPGLAVQSIVFFRNRLWILAGDAVSSSRVGTAPGGYYSFFRETLTALLDSDPIAKEIPDIGSGVARTAVGFSEQLIVFTDNAQYSVNSGTTTMTPESAEITRTTQFATDSSVQPVSVGQNIFFSVNSGQYSQIREYFVQADTLTNDAADITAHVPRYIPKNIKQITGNTVLDAVFVTSFEDNGRIYVYKYFWDADRKAQSAWGYWQIPTGWEILSIELVDIDLLLVLKSSATNGLLWGTIRFNGTSTLGYSGASEPPLSATGISSFYIDGLVPVTGVFGGVNTVFTVPYDIQSNTPVVVKGPDWTSTAGDVLTIDSTNVTTTGSPAVPITEITVVGDFSTHECWAGLPMNSTFTYSEQFIQDQSNSNVKISRLTGRIQLKRMYLRFSNSGPFTVDVASHGRPTRTTEPDIPDDAAIGSTKIGSGVFQFPVLARSSDVTITVRSTSWYPMTLIQSEWAGVFSNTPVHAPSSQN